MSNPLEALDEVMRNACPHVYDDLRPGIQVRAGAPKDLREWFAWHDGQPFDTKHQLFGTYSFVDYASATSELAEMRSTIWKSPLNFIALAAFSRRSFYTLPLLTDVAGDGYCYNLIRRLPYYRFKGERDIHLPSFAGFIDFLVNYVGQPTADAATSFEERFLQAHY